MHVDPPREYISLRAYKEASVEITIIQGLVTAKTGEKPTHSDVIAEALALYRKSLEGK
jgi:hypothetical protein